MPRRDDHRWAEEPGRLTLLDIPHDLWVKLDWEVGRFREAIDSLPRDADAMVYTAQNVCITCVALYDWAWIEYGSRHRVRGERAVRGAFDAIVDRLIPGYRVAKAVAGTFKHGRYRDEGLTDVELLFGPIFTQEQQAQIRVADDEDRDQLVWELGQEVPYQFVFRFLRDERIDQLDARELFAEMVDGWLWLLDNELTEEPDPGPQARRLIG